MIHDLRDALITELRELLIVERQIAKALPRMAKKAEHPELRSALEAHQRQTEEQGRRLEEVLEALGEKPRGRTCKAIQGLIDESKTVLSQDAEPHVLDAMMIAAAQKLEHYEIGAYGTVCTWAEELDCGEKPIRLLKQTLAEEKETDGKLSKLAVEAVNLQAIH